MKEFCEENQHLHGTGGKAPHLALAQNFSKGPDENLGFAHHVRNTTLPSQYCALASEQVYPEVEQGDSICQNKVTIWLSVDIEDGV